MKLKHLVFPLITLFTFGCKNSTGTNTLNSNDSTLLSTTENIIKINDMDSLYQEYTDNPFGIKDWLMDSPIELTGYFDNEKFRTYTEYPNNNHPEIHNMRLNVVITTDVSEDNFKSHSIIRNPSDGHGNWLYDKEDGKVYIEDDVMEISSETNTFGGLTPYQFTYLSYLFDESSYSSMKPTQFDNVLNGLVKDEMIRRKIRSNNVSILPYPLSLREDLSGFPTRVIDKVTIRGKVYKMELRNTEHVGEIMDLRLRNVKIINTTRLFDIDKVPVLDYSHVMSVISKNKVDTTNTNSTVN